MASSIPIGIAEEIEIRTGSRVKAFFPASGGCINHGGKVVTNDSVRFLKWNDRKKFPAMLDAEARGLALLRQTGSLAVPQVMFAGESGDYQFLLMEYIDEGFRDDSYWKNFGSRLAQLHRTTSVQFGLQHDNYIGSLPQMNTSSFSWVEFFTQRRLSVQLRTAADSRKIDGVMLRDFETLYAKLPSIVPNEPPALLHGDLWAGNLITTSVGQPCLIDPAVYFGHREVDLAMTQLFGGFDASFFDSYHESFPLSPGYSERFDLYNLYPLLVHLNLFGGTYLQQVRSVLRKFV